MLDQEHLYSTAADRLLHAWIGRFTQSLSPVSLTLAYLDWALHLAMSPGLQADLGQRTGLKLAQFLAYARESYNNPDAPGPVEPLPGDQRFREPEWKKFPFSVYAQSFLLSQQWWYVATQGVRGPTQHHKDVAWFAAKQLLDMVSPANFPLTNPVILQRTMEQGGMNLVRGWSNFWDDQQRQIAGQKPAGAEQFKVGKNLATTPGKVVYRNRLMELIQYSPSTEKVHPEPIFIVPAWIMKYYILDLSPNDSLIKYLVDKGHTVFTLSWCNPGPRERDLDMEDYLRLGIQSSLDAINAIVPGQKIHGAGYCLGGTLLTIATATMARDGEQRLASMTLFAAQTDFRQAGELLLYIDDSQLTFLEDLMWDTGYLDTRQMAGAFQLLRSNDLIWSRMVREYFLGERIPLIDLMAWNADATRMPYRMHSEYLRKLFLNNDLSNGRYQVEDKPVVLSDIHIPVFVVATEQDHIAPWHSVYKFHLQADAPVTFLLTSGGHNAGIVNPPTPGGRRYYRVATREDQERYIDPDSWRAKTPQRQGSWWPEWQAWLVAHSTEQLPPPSLGASERGYPPLEDAPGTYVFQS